MWMVLKECDAVRKWKLTCERNERDLKYVMRNNEPGEQNNMVDTMKIAQNEAVLREKNWMDRRFLGSNGFHFFFVHFLKD